jgi:acyl carrier protein
MTRPDIERDVTGFLRESFFQGRNDEIQGEGSLLGTVIDSTGILLVVMYLQEHFGITVEDDEIVPGNLDSVQHIVAYVDEKLHAKA